MLINLLYLPQRKGHTTKSNALNYHSSKTTAYFQLEFVEEALLKLWKKTT